MIGAVTFGGGSGMISMIREKMLDYGWLTDEELLNMVAVAESTPGPIAVNIATFVGSSQGGILGAFIATLGIILPSFIIILLIASLIKNFLKYKGVEAFLFGVRPAVCGLILATAITMFMSTVLGMTTVQDEIFVDIPAVIIFAVLIGIYSLTKASTKKKPSPIIMILISAALGMAAYTIEEYLI